MKSKSTSFSAAKEPSGKGLGSGASAHKRDTNVENLNGFSGAKGVKMGGGKALGHTKNALGTGKVNAKA
jgi:hypothetical protein